MKESQYRSWRILVSNKLFHIQHEACFINNKYMSTFSRRRIEERELR